MEDNARVRRVRARLDTPVASTAPAESEEVAEGAEEENVPLASPVAPLFGSLRMYRDHRPAQAGKNLLCISCGRRPRSRHLAKRWMTTPCAGEAPVAELPLPTRLAIAVAGRNAGGGAILPAGSRG